MVSENTCRTECCELDYLSLIRLYSRLSYMEPQTDTVHGQEPMRCDWVILNSC